MHYAGFMSKRQRRKPPAGAPSVAKEHSRHLLVLLLRDRPQNPVDLGLTPQSSVDGVDLLDRVDTGEGRALRFSERTR